MLYCSQKLPSQQCPVCLHRQTSCSGLCLSSATHTLLTLFLHIRTYPPITMLEQKHHILFILKSVMEFMHCATDHIIKYGDYCTVDIVSFEAHWLELHLEPLALLHISVIHNYHSGAHSRREESAAQYKTSLLWLQH